jgi:hypothetical protein
MADAEGYRQGDAASSSSEILRSIIFNKLPLLNSPGELVPNTLYYDAQNSSVQAAEMTNFFGRDRIAFNNKNFGSTPTVHIPNVFFINTSFVVAELNYNAVKYPDKAVSKDLSKFYMPHGWGFHMIENIVYYLGSSSVANIQISGVANFIFHMASCETQEKRNSVLDGAGKYLNNMDEQNNPGVSGNPSSQLALAKRDSFLFRNRASGNLTFDPATNGWVPINELDPTLGMAIIPIRMPFSSMCAIEKRISLDTKLLQQPIQLTVTLRDAAQIMELGTDLDATSSALIKDLRNISFQSFQQGLSDQSLSLRNELLANPQFSVGIPFQYIQDMRFNVTSSQGGLSIPGSTLSTEYFVNITSMLNADLTTIQFALQWDKDQRPSGTANRFTPFHFIEMLDMQLLLNGQRLHNYDGASFKHVYNAQVISPIFPTVREAPYITTHGGEQARQRTIESDVHIYEINFSRLRAVAMEAHMMNTPRFTNQTMQLAFKLNLGSPNFIPAQTPSGQANAGPALTLHTSYYYNAVFMVGQDGGQSKLITA